MKAQKPLNKLLLRQIRRKVQPGTDIPPDLMDLIHAISDSYDHFERDRKLIERAMERSSEELRSSFEKLLLQNELERRNKELNQFVSMASHDLKAPLRTVKSFAALLKRQLGENIETQTREFLDFIIGGIKSMDSLLQSLLDYAQGSGKTKMSKWVDVGQTVELVRKNCMININEKNAKIIVGDNMPKIWTDPFLLLQLFQNLVCNGLKFQKKGSIPEIYINVSKQNEHYLFSIKDNGIGISKENQKKVFDVFQRLHTNQLYEGSGLGLSICHNVAQKLGGKIWVESELGVGSTFFFTIPYSEMEMAENKVEEQEEVVQ